MARKAPGGYDLQNTGKIVNSQDGSAPTDLVTLQQVQAYVRGLSWKASARVKGTGNITLTAPGATINGVTMVSGDRFLAPAQTTGADNGLYVWNGAATASTRAPDADTAAELVGAAVYITEGTVDGDTMWVQRTDPITLGTTALSFTQFGGGGVTYTGQNAITITSGVVALLLDSSSGLIQSGTGLKIDPAYGKLVTKYAADVPFGSTTATVTHNLGTVDRVGEPLVTIKSTGEIIEIDILLGINADTLTFAVAPTASQYRYSTAA